MVLVLILEPETKCTRRPSPWPIHHGKSLNLGLFISELTHTFNALSLTGNGNVERESGTSSPEHPIQYREEGTPGDCISRVSSLSSLASTDKNKAEKVGGVGGSGLKNSKPIGKQKRGDEGQSKVVTFGQTEHYTDETPLMFSRYLYY